MAFHVRTGLMLLVAGLLGAGLPGVRLPGVELFGVELPDGAASSARAETLSLKLRKRVESKPWLD